MPSATFYNLPEEKRQRLMDAVWQEFTEVSYMEASINRIIQKAEISRGSFYQYFSGKQELFAYLLQTVLQEIKNMVRAQLTTHGNDLFSAVLGMYDVIIWKKSRDSVQMQKIQALLQFNTELDLCQFAESIGIPDAVRSIEELLRQNGYVLQEPMQYQAVLHLCVAACMSNLAETIRHPDREAKNRRVLEFQLQLIRQGLMPYKGEETTC